MNVEMELFLTRGWSSLGQSDEPAVTAAAVTWLTPWVAASVLQGPVEDLKSYTIAALKVHK